MKLFYNNKHTQTTKFYETVFITIITPKLQNSLKLFLQQETQPNYKIL